jgi:hypothetical protein
VEAEIERILSKNHACRTIVVGVPFAQSSSTPRLQNENFKMDDTSATLERHRWILVALVQSLEDEESSILSLRRIIADNLPRQSILPVFMSPNECRYSH